MPHAAILVFFFTGFSLRNGPLTKVFHVLEAVIWPSIPTRFSAEWNSQESTIPIVDYHYHSVAMEIRRRYAAATEVCIPGGNGNPWQNVATASSRAIFKSCSSRSS